MTQRSGLTHGDRRRNSRIEEFRAVIRPDRAILSIDLGEDKQVAALMDYAPARACFRAASTLE